MQAGVADRTAGPGSAIVLVKGFCEWLYDSAMSNTSSSLRWSVRIWNLNLSVALAGSVFSKAIFKRENSLGFECTKSGMVGVGPLYTDSGSN